MLSVAGLNVSIRNVQILRAVSLELPTGTMAGLIGRNGAGKTTLMKSLMGLLKVGSGTVRFGDTSPIVPMLAETWPSRCQICRVNAATEVLPLVPVTPTVVAGCVG